MRSGGLLLLVGLLALWAELPHVSGQKRPEFCYLPAETGPWRVYVIRFFYNKSSGECEPFFYGSCQGNANNFKTLEECRLTCVEKPGRCPPEPPGHVGPCIARCSNDWDCPGKQKCCGSCPRDCTSPI
ncbi:kunitz-type serine protease inhibitor bitisilin-1-like [Rhineura floridana]|uniref:kunitz-type serine protease inhibitor bitisilin-1-like n=1 Tax=Rhineura floridana TaxID=261503 RepID=UPI002AC88CBC|nr:kunitz-type serine protease inhibitor bitisilin-1-like [Rhineura floridana]